MITDRRGVVISDDTPALPNDPTAAIAIKSPCRVGTVGNITLAGLQVIDGVQTLDGDRVLVWHQTDTTQNGLYLASSGNWQRTPDADGSHELVVGTRVLVNAGATLALRDFVFGGTDPIAIGTDPITVTELAPGAELHAIENIATTGLAARTGSASWVTRTLTAPAAGLAITNPGGVAGNPTFAFANDLAAVEALSATGLVRRTGTDTWSAGTTVSVAEGGTGATSASGTALDSITGFSSTGTLVRTAAGTYAFRTLTAPAAGITVTNGSGVSGNPTLALANDLAALEALSSTGLAARTATDTWTVRTVTAPAAGITVSNGDGVSGNPTLALANDLAAVEALSATGLVRRTGTDAWSAGTTVAILEGGTGATSAANARANLGATAVPLVLHATKNGTNQTGIADSIFTKVTFGTEDFDDGGYFDNATNFRYTPPAGPVLLDFSISTDGTNLAAGSLIVASIYKNGSRWKDDYVTVGGTWAATARVVVTDKANGSDYYEGFAYMDTTGGAGVISGTTSLTYFSAISYPP